MLESPIRPAMRSPLQQALDRIGSAPAVWTPATLFAASEQGVWYDPSDFSTLFQDSAGTVPVTATGQVVGKMLDKSGRGNHATQATTASKPLYQSPVARLENDGVDDKLLISAIPTSTDRDIFILVYRNTSAAGMLLSHQAPSIAFVGAFDGTASSPSTTSGTPTYAVNGVAVAGGTATTRSQLNSAIPVGAWSVVEIRNVNMTVYASTITFCSWYNAGFTLNGGMGGAVMCPAQDATKRGQIRRYLGAKAGLSL